MARPVTTRLFVDKVGVGVDGGGVGVGGGAGAGVGAAFVAIAGGGELVAGVAIAGWLVIAGCGGGDTGGVGLTCGGGLG